MKILGFDTSTPACSAALLVDDQIYAHFQIAPRRHAELILGFVRNLLDEAQLELRDLDAIAFGAGPGSFMGNRIATGVAQGLAFGVDKPLVAVSTLQSLAQTAYLQQDYRQVLAGWDARMHAIYLGYFVLDEHGIMRAVDEEKLLAPDDLSLRQQGNWVAVGNAWQEYATHLPAGFVEQVQISETELYPRAHALVQIARDKFARDELLQPENAEPVYLRDTVVRVVER